MWAYVIRRVWQMLPTMLGVVLLVFILFNLFGGDPAYVLAGKTVGFSLEEVREMLDLYDLGDGQVTQLKVALAKFAERIERLERQKADIDRVVAELTRASDAMKAKLAARGIVVE